MGSNLTDIKSPLVLVCSKGVDKLLSGLNICGLGAHGPVAYQPISLRDETAAMYVSLAKFLPISICSHRTFPVFEKSEKEQVFNYHSISLTGLLVKSQVKFDNVNQFLRL